MDLKFFDAEWYKKKYGGGNPFDWIEYLKKERQNYIEKKEQEDFLKFIQGLEELKKMEEVLNEAKGILNGCV